jgi:DNA-directed RNA polymerase beta' subunit
MNLQLKEQKEKGANLTILNELQSVLQYYTATLMDNAICG